MASEEPRGRPRLNLKPRDESAAAKLAQDRAKAQKSNPFGEAKPRESILATRTGQKEEDILKAELEREKLKLRFTAEQHEQRQAAQAAITDLEEALKLEEGEKKAEIQSELEAKKADLKALLADFERLAIERAKAGEGMRPSERRRLANAADQDGRQGGYNAPPSRGGSSGDYGLPPSGDFPGGRGGGRGYNAPPSAEKAAYNGGGSAGYEHFGNGSGPRGNRGFKQENGRGSFNNEQRGPRSSYNEPLAQDYEPATRGAAIGGRPPGSFDIFANNPGYSEGDGPSTGGGFARGQDRF